MPKGQFLGEFELYVMTGALARYHLLPAAKADILRRLGRTAGAWAACREALILVTNPAERRYLERRRASCGEREPAH